jgi:hypothetical protein
MARSLLVVVNSLSSRSQDRSSVGHVPSCNKTLSAFSPKKAKGVSAQHLLSWDFEIAKRGSFDELNRIAYHGCPPFVCMVFKLFVCFISRYAFLRFNLPQLDRSTPSTPITQCDCNRSCFARFT